jgi:hypothetical protein
MPQLSLLELYKIERQAKLLGIVQLPEERVPGLQDRQMQVLADFRYPLPGPVPGEFSGKD